MIEKGSGESCSLFSFYLTTKIYKVKNIKITELLILAVTIVVIFVSEYHYIVEKDVNKAIFIGLWPPTILGILNYVNSKKQK